jgi:hypothetical protein
MDNNPILPARIRVLFVAANPLDQAQLRLDEEIRDITAKIRASEYRDSVELISAWAARPTDLLQSLNQYRPHVVHFSGHGSEEGDVVFMGADGSAKPVSREAIVEVMKTAGDEIRLVLFNACFSSAQAEALTRHVDAAIGMSEAIGDEAARVFAAQFYSAVGFGHSVERSFRQARAALMIEGISEEDTPQLFTRDGMDADNLVLVRPPTAVGTGVPVTEEGVLDIAVKLGSAIDFESERSQWLSSEQGKRDAEREVGALVGEIEAIAKQINVKNESFQLEIGTGKDGITLGHPRGVLTVNWWCTYANTLSSSGLVAKIWNRKFHPQGIYFGGEKPKTVKEMQYNADLGPGHRPGWREKGRGKEFLTSSQLAEALVRKLLNRIEDEEKRSAYHRHDREDRW